MSGLPSEVRETLRAHGDPQRAVSQQRYLKSTMPCYGVPNPQIRVLLRPLFNTYHFTDPTEWLATAQQIWDNAEAREERYAAIGLLRHRLYRRFATTFSLPYVDLLRHFVYTGAWWDLVDEIASHCVGDLLRADPEQMTPVLRGWAHESDLWLRRTSIIAQLRSKAGTDLDLLAEAINGSVDDADFFARKAIGWALREYSKTDPKWVCQFVDEHQLSSLSRREALAWLAKQTNQPTDQ